MNQKRSGFFLLLAFLNLMAGAKLAFAAENLDQAVQYLVHYVEKSNYTFIRNGAEHTGNRGEDMGVLGRVTDAEPGDDLRREIPFQRRSDASVRGGEPDQ